MPSLVKPAEYARPFYDRTAEHDSPCCAGTDQAHRQQTDNLIWKLSGTTRSWVWGYRKDYTTSLGPTAAPLASLTAVDTWVTFAIDGENMGLPWRFTEGHEKILCYTQVVCNADVALKVRWDSDTLLDAVAGATGETAGSDNRAKHEMISCSWQQQNRAGGGVYGLGGWYSWLTPTVPANRRIKLIPKVKAPSDNALPDGRWDISGAVQVWMVSASIMDVPARSEVGW